MEILGLRRVQAQRGGLGLRQLGIVDVARLAHAPQHDGAPLQREFRIDERRIDRGRRWHAGDQGRLRQGQLLRRLGEVHPGGVGDAVGAGAQVDDIDVLLEDLLLAELTLDLAGQQRFLQLAPEGPVLAQEDRARQLLGDRARTLLHRALAEVAQARPQDADGIDAVVLVEAAILGRHERLADQQRHPPGGQFFARGRPLFDDHLAVGVEHRERARPAEGVDPVGVGQGAVDRRGDGRLAEGHTDPDGCGGEGRHQHR